MLLEKCVAENKCVAKGPITYRFFPRFASFRRYNFNPPTHPALASVQKLLKIDKNNFFDKLGYRVGYKLLEMSLRNMFNPTDSWVYSP